MKMVNLKAESGEVLNPMPAEGYGYGLRIYLDDEACEKLGITKAVRAGAQVTLQAKAIVVSSTESLDNDNDGGTNEVCLSLQITDMGLQVGQVLRNAAQALYGGTE
jgi:hypothetical protein